MRFILSILGIAAALVMAGVSAAMNYLFLSSLGKTPIEAQVLGAASSAADLLKCLLPFFIAWSWRARRVVAAASGAALFMFFSGFSLLSAIGFAADTRGQVTEGRAAMRAAYEGMQRDLSAAERRLAALPAHRPAGVTAEDIRAHQQHRRWQSTKGCTDATETASRVFCAAFFALRSELAAGEERARLENQMAELKNKAQQLRDAGAGQAVDPQVSLLARIFAAEQDRVRLALIIVIALLVETGSSLGLYLASGHGGMRRAAQRAQSNTPPAPALIEARPIGGVEDFVLEALVPMPGASLTMAELYAAYAEWCARRHNAALGAEQFAAEFSALAQAVNLRQTRGRYAGIALGVDQAKAA
ncbi:MAG: hypothetical protein KJ587_02755 [Alphaproteobacteria bacterium]|nr:hypothetical protein [Alphaproteobacteria bacterium]